MPGPVTDELDMTAAELALGVLDGVERAGALRRVLAEPAFAAEVERWRDQFGLLFDGAAAAEPSPALFDRIARSLDGRPAPAVLPARRGWVWPSLAGVSSLAAAAALALLVTRPEPAPRPTAPVPSYSPPMLAAAITPAGPGMAGRDPITAIYDQAGILRLTAGDLAGATRSAELWVIGVDGTPYSLGLLEGGHATTLTVAIANRPRLTAAAVLAVSIEPLGGSRTGAPTGPVVAKGSLSRT